MKVKKILIMFIALIMCANTVTLANGLTRNIDAVFNSVNLTVNGSPVYADNILYNGTTYVPLRKTSEILGCTVNWDDTTKTASINKPGNSESKEIGDIFWALKRANDINRYGNSILDIAKYTLTYSHWTTPRYSNNKTNFDFLTSYYTWSTEYKKDLEEVKEYFYNAADGKTSKENIDNLYRAIQKYYDNLTYIYNVVNTLATTSNYICSQEVFSNTLSSFGDAILDINEYHFDIYNDTIKYLWN